MPAINQVFQGATDPSPDTCFRPQDHGDAALTRASMERVLDPGIDPMIEATRSGPTPRRRGVG